MVAQANKDAYSHTLEKVLPLYGERLMFMYIHVHLAFECTVL
uniref:Uncharacterized protein n=1 Tax=Setaria italica TaxID=4555 RepID=K3YFK1_SETIT